MNPRMLESSAKLSNILGESHIDYRKHWVIITQRTWAPPPAICVISRFLTKLIVFQKYFWMVLGYKRVNGILEELSNLYSIVLLILFFRGLLLKIQPSWGNYLFQLQNQAKHNTNVTEHDWTWFLYCFWLQEFIQEQT